MKYIFFGSPEFAAVILEKLIRAGFIPEAVVCNPDKPVGRKKIIAPPPVKQVVKEYVESSKYDIKIFQPENIMEIKNQLSDVNCQLFIVAAYAKIIPKEIFEIPRLGTIGVHPSILPKHRGPTPIQTAILNNDKETGTTIFLVDEKVDHGPILAQRELNYELRIMNYELLMRKLAELSANLLIETLPKIEEKIKNAIPQNESQATYTKKFKAEDAFINPEDLEKARGQGGEIAIRIERKIRALNPEPGVWTLRNGKRIKILEAAITIDGKLQLKKIQKEGKKPESVLFPKNDF